MPGLNIKEQIEVNKAVFLKPSFPYMKMQDPKDCGLVAELSCLTFLGLLISYESTKNMMGWHQDIGNLTDTTWHHSKLLNKLKIPHKISLKGTQNQILQSLRKNKPIIILVKTGTLKYHWCVVTGFDTRDWFLSWGDGFPVKTSKENFTKIFTGIMILFY